MTCDHCRDKDHTDQVTTKKIGSRYYCIQCGAYLGADEPRRVGNLPHTWWRY